MLIFELGGTPGVSPAVRALVREAERALRTRPAAGIVLNVSELQALDSAGVGELVRLYSVASRSKLSVAMSGANRRVLEVLRITRVDAFFPQYDDEANAVAGLLSQGVQSRGAGS